MTVKKIAYKGDLAKPIICKPWPLIGFTIADELAEIERVHQEEDRKLHLLLQHFDIPDDERAWKALALHLARRHVPGFKIGKPPGRPSKTQDALGLIAAYVVICVERLQAQSPGLKIDAAVERLSKSEPWKGARIGQLSLRRLYFEARRDGRGLEVLRDAIALNEAFAGAAEGVTPAEQQVIDMIRTPRK